MTNVLAFRQRPAPEPLPVMPTAEEVAAAMSLVDHAVATLGDADLGDLGSRLLAALTAQADAEPDNAADAVMHRRAAEANVLIAAAAFRDVARVVADIRAVVPSC